MNLADLPAELKHQHARITECEAEGLDFLADALRAILSRHVRELRAVQQNLFPASASDVAAEAKPEGRLVEPRRTNYHD